MFRSRGIRRWSTAVVGIAGPLLVLTACGSSGGSASTSGSPSPTPAFTETKDATIAAEVPAGLVAQGHITVASDASYPPNEFFASNNQTIIGMDVDLGTAIGQVLGVPFRFTNVVFDSIIPNLGTRYDIGISSFTDTKAREKQVNMVTYFNAGISFMVASSSSLNITGLASLCGHSVAVEKGTTELDDANAQLAKCRQMGKGKLTVDAYQDENGVNLALSSGRDEVVLADTPVNDYLVKQSHGQFKLVGPKYGFAPYGIAVPKTAKYAGLDQAIRDAVKKIMSDGVYLQILQKWSIQAGAITNPVINGAVS